jgi:hypothetical protein
MILLKVVALRLRAFPNPDALAYLEQNLQKIISLLSAHHNS